MNATRRAPVMQRRHVIQHELLPELRDDEVGTLTRKLETVIQILEWTRIGEFIESSWCGSAIFVNSDFCKRLYCEQGPTAYEQARTAQHQTEAVMKCNFCRDRVRAGKQPACVANCPTAARIFGGLDDPTCEVSRPIKKRGGFPLHPEARTKPSVYYLPP